MFRPVIALIILIVGVVAGYGVRALISRKRRAAAREEWLWQREQKRYDDGLAPKSPSTFTISDEALVTTLTSDPVSRNAAPLVR
jgi:hypothetical protein